MTFAPDALAGRPVLVTGASSGIGRHAAKMFASHGAILTLIGRDVERLENVRTSLDGSGHVAVSADLDDMDAAADVVADTAKRVGPLAGIFHAAGAAMIAPTRLTRTKQLDSVMGAGFRGAFGIAKGASRKDAMSDGSSMVFMSSVAAVRGTGGMAAYSAAKAAVEGMVRSLACELAERRIRVNSIVAGAVETEMHDAMTATMNPAMVDAYRDKHLLGFGTADDIAHAALFLLSDASRWITGTSFVVDGGYTAK